MMIWSQTPAGTVAMETAVVAPRVLSKIELTAAINL